MTSGMQAQCRKRKTERRTAPPVRFGADGRGRSCKIQDVNALTRGENPGGAACRDNHAKGSHCRDAYSGRP